MHARRIPLRWLLMLALSLALTPAAVWAQMTAAPGEAAPGETSLATNAPPNAPLSTRVVDYNLDAHVDVTKKTIDATEAVSYKNLTGQPLTSFPFHLYLNAFEPQSTFTTETHFGGGIRDSESANDYPAKKFGSITITALTADRYGDLTGAIHFVAPDDGNGQDRTVMVVDLPRPVAPGDSITFRMRFHDVLPESVARNGYKRDFLMGGQWFPKIGVFWRGAWNRHQYHATTEFFSDFGTYTVHLTLPRNYTVGASGVPTGSVDHGDGTRTLSFYGEDIIDFAWAASPHFTVTTGTYLSSMGPVQVRVLALAAHPLAGARYMKILMGSLDQFERRFGPYPYKILTLVDPEPGSEIGGMEYPTLITGDASLLDPTELQEITAEHEFGHQYWYAMVATNEFEDAWLDEGINSYTEAAVTGALLGENTSVLRQPWANLSDRAAHYGEYIADANYDPVTRYAWKFRDANSYGAITYGKSSVLLRTLEGLIGADTMAEAMRTYFMRYRFTHPGTDDFLRTIEEVAIARGRAEAVLTPEATLGPGMPAVMVRSSTLEPYWRQAVYGTAELDYAVDSIQSGPAEWWLPHHDEKLLRDSVTVRRRGDFILPVTLEVRFADGYELREHWDPPASSNTASEENTRWRTWTYIGRHGEIVSAEIDPDHAMALDVDHFNDSRTVAANKVPALKLAAMWSNVLQLASQLSGWLV